MFASPEEMAVLESDEGVADAAAHHKRIAAVWAHAHDLAAAKVGESEIGQFFVHARGLPLLSALEAMPFTATCDEMMVLVNKHLGIEK